MSHCVVVEKLHKICRVPSSDLELFVPESMEATVYTAKEVSRYYLLVFIYYHLLLLFLLFIIIIIYYHYYLLSLSLL